MNLPIPKLATAVTATTTSTTRGDCVTLRNDGNERRKKNETKIAH